MRFLGVAELLVGLLGGCHRLLPYLRECADHGLEIDGALLRRLLDFGILTGVAAP